MPCFLPSNVSGAALLQYFNLTPLLTVKIFAISKKLNLFVKHNLWLLSKGGLIYQGGKFSGSQSYHQNFDALPKVFASIIYYQTVH